MRLDKFLKVSRLVKRRTLAKEVCTQGRVFINGRTAKAGTEVNPGDRLLLDFGRRQLEVEVLSTPETVRGDGASDLYRVLADQKKEESGG